MATNTTAAGSADDLPETTSTVAATSPSTALPIATPLTVSNPSANEFVESEAPIPNLPVEVDDRDDTDADSALGTDISSYTTSLASSVKNYTYENGRTYHSYREGQYMMPNDDIEQERLDMLHHIWRLMLNGDLFRAPISKNVQRVLDIGTGTGIWAIDFADEFPSAQVIGNDLSPIQPSFLPPNCSFEVDDCEMSWPHSLDQKFDFIHLRSMAGSITNWPKLFSQAYAHSKPGGWIELQEYAIQMHAEEGDEHLPETIVFWLAEMDKASKIIDKSMDVVAKLKNDVTEAGFTAVPFGPWPKDKRLKQMGQFQQLGLLESIEAYSLALFTRVLNYDLAELHVLLAQVRAEIKDPKNHMYCNAHFIYGQKPLEGTDSIIL